MSSYAQLLRKMLKNQEDILKQLKQNEEDIDLILSHFELIDWDDDEDDDELN